MKEDDFENYLQPNNNYLKNNNSGELRTLG